MTLTQERLKEVLHYDHDTGVFTWITKIGTRVKSGDNAGCNDGKGYLSIMIDYKNYRCHRLAWLYVYGVLPSGKIDHRDTIRNHNWISNLRDVTHVVNLQNQKKCHKHNATGFLGVSLLKSGKYASQIKVKGNVKYLGTFTTPEEAHKVYVEAKRIYHEGCTI